MDEATRMLNTLMEAHHQDQIAVDGYMKQVMRYTKILRILLILTLLVSAGAIGIALYVSRDQYPVFATTAWLIAQMSLFLVVSFLISRWLSRVLQMKIDRSNAKWYGHNWFK
jgi:hypothetical protein